MTRSREVEAEYRDTFEDFSRKAQHMQLLTAQQNTDGKDFEAALLELERAHLAYNQARDTFLQSLLPDDGEYTVRRHKTVPEMCP